MKKLFPIILLVLLLPISSVFARAGGGSGSSSGSSCKSTLCVVMYAVVGIGYGILHISLKNKVKKSRRKIKELQNELNWNEEVIQERIKKIFPLIQNAGANQLPEKVSEYLTEKYFQKFSSQINDLKNKNEKNIIKNIVLKNAEFLSIHNYEGFDKDYFWMKIDGKADEDYRINIITRNRISDSDTSGDFTEFWKFRCIKGNWLLDDIDSKVSFDDIWKQGLFFGIFL